MDALPTYMFDTNVFNRILDGGLSLQTLKDRVVAYATHIQRDEINNTKDPARREALARIFSGVVAGSVSTESAVVGVSRVGEARVGGERLVPTESAVYDLSRHDYSKYSAEDGLYSSLKRRLDGINGCKSNNVHDALIAETSIKGGHVFVTDDGDLAAVTKEYGGQCLSVAELLSRYDDGATEHAL